LLQLWERGDLHLAFSSSQVTGVKLTPITGRQTSQVMSIPMWVAITQALRECIIQRDCYPWNLCIIKARTDTTECQ
jgi:hypothetical protein